MEIRMKRFAAAVVLVVGFAVPAVAQTGTETVIQGDDRIVYKKHTIIEIDESEVEGTKMPTGAVFTIGKRPTDFENRIKLRASFVPELQKSVDNL